MHKKTLNEYVSLIQSHIAEGNLKACIHTLEQTIIEYPDQNNFKINLGNIFTTLEDFESAEQIYLNLINTDLEKEAHNNLSVIYLKIGNTEKSIFHSKSALDLDINYKDAKYNLALAYYENKEFKKSINICKELNLDTDYKNKANELQYRGCQVSCDWIEYKTIVDLLSKNKTVVHPFLHVSYVMDEQSNFTNAKSWNKPIAKIEKNLSMVSGQKIKLGFLCGEIRNHPTFFLIKNLFKYMNKDLFSLFLFSYGHTQNEMNYIRDEFEEIIDITNSTDDKARDIIKSYS